VTSRSARAVVSAILLLVLVGATVFGLWHLIVGGVLHGNARAATFGLVLAAGAGAVLGGVVVRTRGGRHAQRRRG
jgi:hypothetical protein